MFEFRGHLTLLGKNGTITIQAFLTKVSREDYEAFSGTIFDIISCEVII
jgi:hypothetical protein